jgi:hypothetical protein
MFRFNMNTKLLFSSFFFKIKYRKEKRFFTSIHLNKHALHNHVFR